MFFSCDSLGAGDLGSGASFPPQIGEGDAFFEGCRGMSHKWRLLYSQGHFQDLFLIKHIVGQWVKKSVPFCVQRLIGIARSLGQHSFLSVSKHRGYFSASEPRRMTCVFFNDDANFWLRYLGWFKHHI